MKRTDEKGWSEDGLYLETTSLHVVPLLMMTRCRLQSCERVAGLWWRESSLFLKRSRELLFVRSLTSMLKFLKLMT